MSSLCGLLPWTYGTAKSLSLKEEKHERHQAFMHEVNLFWFQPILRHNTPEENMPISLSGVKRRAEKWGQRGPASFVHLLCMEHRYIPQLPACTARAECPETGPLTHVNGAAKERAFLKCLLNYSEEVGWCLLQLIPFCNTTSEVLETFSGGATRERLVRAVQPAWKGTNTHNHQSPYFPLVTHTTIRFPIVSFSWREGFSSPTATAFMLSTAPQQLWMHHLPFSFAS